MNVCVIRPMICALQPYSTAENDNYKAFCGYLGPLLYCTKYVLTFLYFITQLH